MSGLGQFWKSALVTARSALPPPKHVGFVPTGFMQAKGSPLFDHLVSERLQCGWHSQAELPCGLEIDEKFVC
jgi:hypothetical protein